MAVILTDGEYSVGRFAHPWTYDPDGTKVPAPSGPAAFGDPLPGASHLRNPGNRDDPNGAWVLRLDPRLWPVADGDPVTNGHQVWAVVGSPRLCRNNADSGLDYIEASAVLNPPTVP